MESPSYILLGAMFIPFYVDGIGCDGEVETASSSRMSFFSLLFIDKTSFLSSIGIPLLTRQIMNMLLPTF